MNYTEPKVIYTCFPGGKHKVLTMSYDDGRLEAPISAMLKI